MTGINTIGVGQIEAARSLGLSFGQMLPSDRFPWAPRTTVLPHDEPAHRRVAHHLDRFAGPARSPLNSPAWFLYHHACDGGILALQFPAAG